MSNDVKGLLEVNRELILQVASEARSASREPVVVICAATWGRGIDPDALLALKAGPHRFGYNSSVVAAPNQEALNGYLNEAAKQHLAQGASNPGRFLVLCAAYGKTKTDWWAFQESEEDSDVELF